MKKNLLILLLCISSWCAAQNIPVSLSYTRLYDFLDELMTDGVINAHQTAVRPYTRSQVADMLEQAQDVDSLLNKRQKADLAFYLNEFALESSCRKLDSSVSYTRIQASIGPL